MKIIIIIFFFFFSLLSLSSLSATLSIVCCLGFTSSWGVTRLPVTRHACYLSTCHKSTAWAPNARGASESDWPPNQQKLETGFEKV